MLKFVSWNVNGLRACMKKGFADAFAALDADCFCLQETKLQPEQLSEVQFEPEGYTQWFHSAVKKGYSGTAVYARQTPLSVRRDFGIGTFEDEGRVLTLEYPAFYLVNAYVPNAQRELTRLSYRMEWEAALLSHLKALDAEKPVIYCGDLNVAHREIDLKNPKPNRGNAGFTDEERSCMTRLLENGFTDSFRFLHPERTGAYSWWSYQFRAREHNAGWRIDYFLVSNRLQNHITAAEIHPDIFGSDHCPVSLTLSL